MIRAVLFDVDDTLVDYSGAEQAGIRRYLADLGVADDALGEGAAYWHAVMERHFARYLDGELDYVGQRRERARDMIGWLARRSSGPTPSEAAGLDAWFDGYRQRYEAALAPFPDVLDCLDQLAGLRLGVVTNNDSGYQRAKLDRIGIGDRFECVVGTDLAAARKPDPAIFQAGCRALDVAPEHAAYVGDHPELDAQAALDAGLTGVWLDRSGGSAQDRGVPRVTSLTELPVVLGVTPAA